MSNSEDRHSVNHGEVVVRAISTAHQTKKLTPNTNNNKNNESSSLNHSVPLYVNSTSSSTQSNKTSTANMNNNKKHNIGFRLRRLFFGSNTNNATIAKQKASRDSEVSENKNFIKHNPSLHSSSSESSNDSRRKRSLTRKSDSSSANWPPNNASLNSYECSICLFEQPLFQFPELKTCQHRACISCLRQYLRIEICESRINITCLQCQELMHPNDIKFILRNDNALIEKYESFMVRRTLITDPDVRWCPAPDCDYCVIASGCASCPMLKCERPGCETLFCYHCKQEWHSNQTCDQARAQRGLNKSVFINSPNPAKSNVTFTSRGTDSFTQANASTSVDSFVQRDDIKPCPCCKVLIIKMNDGSCNHMTCSVCGTEFCWLCMQKISDLHYLSPSGCTFWGKKPWSRKKKIMWQLGMLVGAPVGIALIAGIAVPAIIIGIPVWVGRKLYSRFERNHMSRHKSNFLVTTGVLTSILVSPILAAVAVGIGVPILLAYVYGVVPISLCRSGGCGVTTSSSGVRIELDEDEIAAPDGVSVDTALSGRAVTNPSIGEVSLGMSASLSIGSSSHLDRVVIDIQPDRESSSIAACAGSITSNVNNPPNTTQTPGQKLETLADINSNQRFSLSSQNADSSSVTLSFGEPRYGGQQQSWNDSKIANGSTTVDAQNANMQEVSLSPVEVHVNNNNFDNAQKNQRTKKFNSQEPQHSKTVQTSTNFILNKFESRSMEYLSNNYCNICYKSHKPCCPNFQHPTNNNNNKSTIKINNKKVLSKPIKNNNNGDGKNDSNNSNEENRVLEKNSPSNKHNQYKQEQKQPETNNNNVVYEHSHYNNNVNNNFTPKLSKKAMSQIFYSNSFIKDHTNNDNKTNNDEIISKSTLSHSLSFTPNNPY